MPQPRPLRVLVVDDYPDTADATVQLAALYGYDARAACSCREARAVVASGFAPDAVLLDLMLSDGDGYALADELCRALPRRPALVLISAKQGQDEPGRAAGIDHVFLKPADPRELRAVLDRYAARVAEEPS